MARRSTAEAGERGSREAWFGAAYDVLIESGVDDVRIQVLSDRLSTARTSFYWFFRDRDALLAALLAGWRDKNTGGLVRQAGAYAESIAEAVFNVFDCWLDGALFDASLEFAVRSWALQSPEVAGEVRTADEARIAALLAMFARFGFEPVAAEVRARTVYLTQIGYISMNAREDLALRMVRIPDYVEIFTGARATPTELARFHARHRFAEGRAGSHPA